jgi:YD repeat-containing protein
MATMSPGNTPITPNLASLIAAEATLARNASNLTSGTVDPARVGDLSATYALVNGTVASVVRDASGKFVSDVEGGVATSVTRDSSGRIATVTTGSTTRTVTRNASGQIVGVA